MGSQMVIVSKNGTNERHGSLFEFLRNSALDARNFFDRKTDLSPRRLPGFTRNQFGGSAGGPIMKDKMFFHATYESLRERTGQTLIFTTIPPSCKVEGAVCPSITGGLSDDLFYTQGPHSFKFGTLINRFQPWLLTGTNVRGVIRFANSQSFLQGVSNNYTAVTPGSIVDRTYPTLKLRAEFFNIFNRTTFDLPSATVFAGNPSANPAAGAEAAEARAGQITATRTTSRQIQFALKVVF
jgi:hypothetical protein